ncbi:hypothetical protein H6B10_17745, partial [Gemmiger formicilis]|uniref:AlkZ-related protein n=1 Tax=Gemmiger formicilis TaxID=745368 RepID=UPI001DB32927|nr:hypothetical protein [Gemmiger formicilis]
MEVPLLSARPAPPAVSLRWRRDGYDFDSRWDDGLATVRQKKIMDQFTEADALLSYE